ncbi:MAG: hypothetical protein DI532_18285 [Azospirillum brasilense]|nr:MAG: hypothetical protein DI532_18285 [Azospirillum brasilense]
MPTIPDFIRSTPPTSLQSYFAAIHAVLPDDVVWEGVPSTIVPPLLRAVDAMTDADRMRVMNDADRVGAMADEAGQAALYAVTTASQTLDALENGHARALWMFLNDQDGFDRAEEVRYADDRRYGRMWDAFECDSGLTVPRAGNPVAAFQKAIADRFDSQNVEVEICDRSRPSLEGDDAELIQVAIYREGRAGDRRAFVNGKLDRLPFRPVIEAAITYEPATGTIEVVAQARETREELVRFFAEHMLGAPFQGERIPIRQYSLDHLLQPFDFPTDIEDNIESVKLTMMRLMPYETQGERVTLECMRGAERSIWQAAAARFGEYDPLAGGYKITQVRFTIRFRAVPGSRGSRTLPVTISMPKGCDLKDRTERERLIGGKYLRRWRLLRDV